MGEEGDAALERVDLAELRLQRGVRLLELALRAVALGVRELEALVQRGRLLLADLLFVLVLREPLAERLHLRRGGVCVGVGGGNVGVG